MPPKAKTVTEAESAIMKLLWQNGKPMPAREIREKLYPDGTPSDHATVQKLLQRLEAKKMIKRDRREFAHRFTAIVSQAEIVGEQLRRLTESMGGGSIVPVLSHFIQHQQLTPKERRQLKRLLDEAEENEVSP